MSSDATNRFAPAALALVQARVRELVDRTQISTLGNGARLFVLPDGKHGVACLEVWIRVGSGDEPKAQAGISHLLEHLMFRGTTALPDGEFDAFIEARGVQANAWTWYDTTAYTSTLPSEALRELMEVESDRLQNLDITKDVFVTEREVVLNERSLTADSDPNALAQEHLDRLLFGVGPYAHPVIGYRENIEGLTREAVLAWYRQHYAPQNLDIIVTGDVDVDAVRAMAEATFGALPALAKDPLADRPQHHDHAAPLEETITVDVAAPSIYIAWPHPARRDLSTTAVWKVLVELLSFGRGGRLRDVLEYDERLVLEQQFYLNEHRLGHSALWDASPREGVSTAVLADRFFAILDEFAQTPPTDEAMDAALLRILTIHATRSTPWQLSRMLGTALHDAGDLSTLSDDLDALAAVRPEDVQALAKTLAHRPNATILHVLPQATHA